MILGIWFLIVTIFSLIGFQYSFGLGLFESGLLVAALVGIPYAADSLIPSGGRDEVFDYAGESGKGWLYPVAYFVIAVGLFYLFRPHVVPRMLYDRSEGAVLYQVGSFAFLFAWPVFMALHLTLDWCGFYRGILERANGQSSPYSGALEETPEVPNDFDPTRFNKEASPPPLVVTRVQDSERGDQDFPQRPPKGTLH